jgi:hypothetical protein
VSQVSRYQRMMTCLQLDLVSAMADKASEMAYFLVDPEMSRRQ